MYEEKRPTCVTVIGWAWIVLGGLMAFSGLMALVGWVLTRGVIQSEPGIPSFLKFFPLLVGCQLVVAVAGLVAGGSFLKLQAWSRVVLEGLTWLVLVFIIIFTIFFFVELRALGGDQAGFGTMVVIMGVAIGTFYGVPLVIMLVYLRGARVRNTMAGTRGRDRASPSKEEDGGNES